MITWHLRTSQLQYRLSYFSTLHLNVVFFFSYFWVKPFLNNRRRGKSRFLFYFNFLRKKKWVLGGIEGRVFGCREWDNVERKGCFKNIKRKPFHRFQSSAFHTSLPLPFFFLALFFFSLQKDPLIAEYLLVSISNFVCFQSTLYLSFLQRQPSCRTQQRKHEISTTSRHANNSIYHFINTQTP